MRNRPPLPQASAHCLVLLLVTLVFSGCHRSSSVSGHRYVTHEQLEVDKLASIWLLQRFVDKEATFEFVKGDSPLTNGIPLDAPEAELRRYANNSCFETIVLKFKVQDPSIQRLAPIVRELELNAWGTKRFPESVRLQSEIKRIIDAHPRQPEMCAREALAVFDRLASELVPPR
jgi:hypothetical protein